MVRILYLLVSVLLTGQALAQPLPAARYQRFGISYDQDYTLEWFGMKQLNEDRNYTMGFGFHYATDAFEKCFLFAPSRWLFKMIKPKRVQYATGFYVMQLANGSFTPDSLPASYPIYNDRPYASLTYLQTTGMFLDREKCRLYTFGLAAGALGTGVSREIQTAIHKGMNNNDTKDPRTPRGWHNQLSDGGALTALLFYQQDHLLTRGPLRRRELGFTDRLIRFGGEWKAAGRLNLGWYNTAVAELSWRFGWLDPRNWMYATNPLGSSSMLFKPNAVATMENYYKREKATELFFFAAIRGNFIGYNALISGQSRHDAVNLPNAWARRGVFDGSLGFCINPSVSSRTNFDGKLKFNFRSPEFEAPGRAPRWHYWMSIEMNVHIVNRRQ
ncbi:lipid A-modifier LpxR family protein [Sediminibacterium soli]|uniref:lipid A-modifier LpxR family protein n=1 Tax=Sediminibacterium soli TaxID=2698829 RepID=UPI00137B32C8|nr:lipid A-modifier LpxR family protein [Sediminibacterium soli]NCI46509.1 lipid A deacylase LpxR family protein [Sediminibacterium soli]